MNMDRIKNQCKRLCGMLAVCATALVLPAQTVYTLDECVDRALQNNARMKNAANDLAGAEQQQKSAFTKYFPSISATGVGFLADEHLLKMDMGELGSMAMLKNGVGGGVTASMPLFTGGQIVNGNRLAQVNVEATRQQHRQGENEVRLTTEQYFWQVVTLKEKLKTLDAVEAQLDRLLKDVEASVEAGVTNRNDLLQVQLRQNDTESSRLTVESALALSRRLLAQYIGADAGDIDVASAVCDSLPASPATLYADPGASLALTPEYNLLQSQLKASRLQYKMTLGKNLPTVAIGGGYMYDNFLGYDQNFWAGFATVSIPLTGWWGGSHDIKRQKLAVRNAENDLRDRGDLLVIRMQSTWDDLNEAYRQVQIALRSIEQSTENLRLNTDYYAAGTSSMSDLLDAQTLYRQSRDKYVEVWAQYEVKKREYLQATGR